LTVSYDQCLTDARTLIGFGRRLGLPFGISSHSSRYGDGGTSSYSVVQPPFSSRARNPVKSPPRARLTSVCSGNLPKDFLDVNLAFSRQLAVPLAPT